MQGELEQASSLTEAKSSSQLDGPSSSQLPGIGFCNFLRDCLIKGGVKGGRVIPESDLIQQEQDEEALVCSYWLLSNLYSPTRGKKIYAFLLH